MTDDRSDRTMTLIRVMDVPARYVFRAFTTPKHLMAWFGPDPYPVTSCTADFREGGRWRMQMTGPDGKTGPWFGGTYLTIEPDRRIVFDDAFEGSDERMTMSVTLDEIDGRTTLTYVTEFPTADMKRRYLEMGMEQGLGTSLDQLVAHVEGAGVNAD